jgi:hypothetical protein
LSSNEVLAKVLAEVLTAEVLTKVLANWNTPLHTPFLGRSTKQIVSRNKKN